MSLFDGVGTNSGFDSHFSLFFGCAETRNLLIELQAARSAAAATHLLFVHKSALICEKLKVTKPSKRRSAGPGV